MSVLDPAISIAIPSLPGYVMAIPNMKFPIQSPTWACIDTLVWVNDAFNTSKTVKAKPLCIVIPAVGEVDRIAVVHLKVLDVKAHVHISPALNH